MKHSVGLAGRTQPNLLLASHMRTFAWDKAPPGKVCQEAGQDGSLRNKLLNKCVGQAVIVTAISTSFYLLCL